jgi:hypothetical protein
MVGSAVLVPRTDALRLEFGPPGRDVRPPADDGVKK